MSRREKLVDKYKTCMFCGTKNNLTVEHIIPKCQGGTNEAENLTLLCQSCNQLSGYATNILGFNPHESDRRDLLLHLFRGMKDCKINFNLSPVQMKPESANKEKKKQVKPKVYIPDKEKIEQLISMKMLTKRDHSYLPLSVYNYTAQCAYEKHWNEHTLHCRGLILDDSYNVIGRCIPKFFNLEEESPSSVPKGVPMTVYEKIDGSLGILCKYKDQLVFSTRGSFDSDQAKEMAKIWFEKYSEIPIEEGNTYIFEIIYPENRIVVNYKDRRELVFLTAINNSTGEEFDIEGFPVPKKYEIEGLVHLASFLMDKSTDNAEGYVLKYKHSGRVKRVKFKFEEYKRLHRYMTGLSDKDIWLALKQGTFKELLESIPDEMFEAVQEIYKDLNTQFLEIEGKLIEAYNRIVVPLMERPRKEQALAIIEQFGGTEYSSLLFLYMDLKPYQEKIWDLLEPKERNVVGKFSKESK